MKEKCSKDKFFAENKDKILAFGEYFLRKLSDSDMLYCKGYLKYTPHYNTRNLAVCDTFSRYCVAGSIRRKVVNMVKMTYHQWEKLAEESKNRNIALGVLPDVPLADLENGLVMARMIIQNGERYWEIKSEGETETKIFPELLKMDLWGVSVTCKFNPYIGKYNTPEITELAGYYGSQWITWMEEHHKDKVREMKSEGTFLAVARSVDRDAWNYRKLLDRQYEELHPRPCADDDIEAWKFTRDYYTDSTTMRDNVLMAVTQPF